MGNKKHTELVERFFSGAKNRNTGRCTWVITNMSCDEKAIYSYSTPLLMRMGRKSNKFSNCEWYLHNTTAYSSFTSKHQSTIHWSKDYQESFVIDMKLSRLINSFSGFSSYGKSIPDITLIYYDKGISDTFYSPLVCDVLPEIVDAAVYIFKGKDFVNVYIPKLLLFDYEEKRHALFGNNLVVINDNAIDRNSFLKEYMPIEIVEDVNLNRHSIFQDNRVFLKRDVEFTKKEIVKNYTIDNTNTQSHIKRIVFSKASVTPDNKTYVSGTVRGISSAYPTRGQKLVKLDSWYQLTYTREAYRYE